jgi:hypothetical protein
VWRGALTGGLSSTVPAGQVLNPIQTDSDNSKWFEQIQNCPNLADSKDASRAPKMGNKIWLGRS